MDYKKTEKRKMTLSRKLFLLSFVSIQIAHFLLFYVYVHLNSFLMGFQKILPSGETVFTFEHFVLLFDRLFDPASELRLAFKNTFLTFLIQFCMYPVGIMVSYFLYKKIKFSNLFRCLFFLPSVVSGVVFAFFYKQLCSLDGVLPMVLQSVCGLETAPDILASEYANTFIWLHMIWLGFPGAMIIWQGTFARIPDSVLEYGKIDGVGWVRELVQLIIPMVWPTFVLFMILQIAGVFSASGAVFLLTPDATTYGTQTVSYWMYIQVYGVAERGGSMNNGLNYLSAFGMVLTVVAFALTILVRKGLVRLVPEVDF